MHRDKAGQLILGDIITGVDGKPVKLQKDLFQYLDEHKVGDKIEIQLMRDGKPKTVPVTLGERVDQME